MVAGILSLLAVLYATPAANTQDSNSSPSVGSILASVIPLGWTCLSLLRIFWTFVSQCQGALLIFSPASDQGGDFMLS